MELRQFLSTMRRRWKLVLVVFLLGVAGAGAITATTTQLYSSTARLFVGTSAGAKVDVYAGALFSSERAASYAELGKDPAVLQRVIDKLDLGVTPAELSPHITITAVPSSVILEVAATSSNPYVAQSIAQAQAEEVQSLIVSLEKPASGGAESPITASLPGKATYNATAVSPLVAINLAVGALLGLLIGICAAVLRDLLDTSIRTAEEVQSVTGRPVMATVPFDSSVSKTPLLKEQFSHTERAEAFRVLRTNFQFVDLDGKAQVFVVSSALPSEGKTNTAINLAITMAQAGRSVLLMDCDFRKPEVSKLLELENVVGVLTILVGKASLEDCVQPHESGIDFLGTGPQPPNPAEVLETQVMRELIATVRGSYDVIIIDAPPLLPVTDPAILASEVDGVLLVARYGKTTHDQLRLAKDRIDAVGGHIFGSVFNMTPRSTKSAYGYGYEYGYGNVPLKENNREKLRRVIPRRGTEGARRSSAKR